jgi:hypothetical protein
MRIVIPQIVEETDVDVGPSGTTWRTGKLVIRGWDGQGALVPIMCWQSCRSSTKIADVHRCLFYGYSTTVPAST